MNLKSQLKFLLALCLTLVPSCVNADTVEITGTMSTSVRFDDQISVVVPGSIRSMTVTVPTPSDSQLFGYSQTLGKVSVTSSRSPSSTKVIQDTAGNKYTVDVFNSPSPGTINFDLVIEPATIAVDLHTPLPYSPSTLTNVPADVQVYLKPTDKVQSQDPIIVSLAHQLKNGVVDEAGVTNGIEEYLQRAITYNSAAANDPDDALYVLKHKTSLCDGWAHLFLALARADGLPARFVGGYNIGGDIVYPVDSQGRSTLTVSSAGEAHSWVDVWFPSVGWVPFEPQASAGFVDSHHLRAWVGQDSDSAANILSWTTGVSNAQDLSMTETENPTQVSDQVNVAYFHSDSRSSEVTTLARRREEQTADPKF